MQDAKAPLSAAVKSSYAATATLLCLVSAPVLAATGVDVICDDHSAVHVEEHAVDDLNIETIDHGLTSAMAENPELVGDNPNEAEFLPLSAREQEILRRIFDETVSGGGAADSNDDVVEAIDTAVIEERSADIADTEPSQEDADSVLPGLRLPDATAEETNRYRRQMYRTDI